MRHDGNSSAEEENKFKDYVRRQAREEHNLEKQAKQKVKEREADMKKIEELKFNKQTIPEELKEKYQDEMSEFQSYDYKKK